jgi:hypothetical protein
MKKTDNKKSHATVPLKGLSHENQQGSKVLLTARSSFKDDWQSSFLTFIQALFCNLHKTLRQHIIQ